MEEIYEQNWEECEYCEQSYYEYAHYVFRKGYKPEYTKLVVI